jgi:TolB protein
VAAVLAAGALAMPAPPPAGAAFPGTNGMIVYESEDPYPELGVAPVEKIYRIGADGSGAVPLTAGPDDREPRWSPDGARIAFARCAYSLSTCDIWIMDGDGTDAVNVTNTPGVGETSPAWSPDGERIVIVRDGRLVVRTLLDGSEVVLTDGSRVDTSPVWSPDGSTIAYSTDGFVATIEPDGTDPEIFSIAGEVGDWSPDGQRLVIALVDGVSSTPKVATLDRDGTDLVELTSSDEIVAHAPRWSPDGSQILYLDHDVGADDMVVMAPDGSDSRVLRVGTFTSVDWQPVGPLTPTFPPVTPVPSATTSTGPPPPPTLAPRPAAVAPRFTG